MNEEQKRLQKDINGKEVIYLNSDGDEFNAILLFPPDGEQVSVKPYGYTDDEFISAMRTAGYDSSREHMTRPKFCFVAIGKNRIAYLKILANTPDGGKIQPSKETSGDDVSIFSPSCPYGA